MSIYVVHFKLHYRVKVKFNNQSSEADKRKRVVEVLEKGLLQRWVGM